jgi:hypothetical protein
MDRYLRQHDGPGARVHNDHQKPPVNGWVMVGIIVLLQVLATLGAWWLTGADPDLDCHPDELGYDRAARKE